MTMKILEFPKLELRLENSKTKKNNHTQYNSGFESSEAVTMSPFARTTVADKMLSSVSTLNTRLRESFFVVYLHALYL